MKNLSFLFGLAHIAEQHTKKKPFLDDFFENEKIPTSQDWKNFEEAQLLDATLAIFSEEYFFSKWLKQHFTSKEQIVFLNKLLFSHLKHCTDHGSVYLTRGDKGIFPFSLTQIHQPPLAITIMGNPNHLSKRCIGIVGSRKASHEALSEAFLLGRMLSDFGVCVVSGGAYGCDIAAHKGCLASKNKTAPTVVVLAGGLGLMYPSGNLSTFKEILLRDGAILSERLWYERPRPYDFPRRNRIISALSDEIILIHAGIKSGAMSTCRHCIEQGKELFVLSPSAGDQTMDGNYQLIEEGADFFYNAEEFVRHHLYAY